MFEEIAAGPHRLSTALLGFFPDLPSERAADFTDGGHRLLRPEAVEGIASSAAGFSLIRPSRSAVFSALRSVERIWFSVACRIRRPSA
ncbi:hypothetical protein [Spirillospora sp. CA-128828]|uniref:hypothetical protein n=1 Tax=Spirillospora sp. CA-128828 TaxID=3240033 RepID=UPI003D9451F3